MHEIRQRNLVDFGVEGIADPIERLLRAINLALDFSAKNKKLLQFVFSESKYLDKDPLKLILEMDN